MTCGPITARIDWLPVKINQNADLLKSTANEHCSFPQSSRFLFYFFVCQSHRETLEIGKWLYLVLAAQLVGDPLEACSARWGWILWVLAPSLWISRLFPHGSSSWTMMARRNGWSGATACSARVSPHPSPTDQISTARSSSCESRCFFTLLLLCLFHKRSQRQPRFLPTHLDTESYSHSSKNVTMK